jgi:hypothetical protein
LPGGTEAGGTAIGLLIDTRQAFTGSFGFTAVVFEYPY